MLAFDPNFDGLQFFEPVFGYEDLNALQVVGQHRERAATLCLMRSLQQRGIDVNGPPLDTPLHGVKKGARARSAVSPGTGGRFRGGWRRLGAGVQRRHEQGQSGGGRKAAKRGTGCEGGVHGWVFRTKVRRVDIRARWTFCKAC